MTMATHLIEEGKLEKALEVVKNMILQGFSIDLIQKVVAGITIQEILA